MNHDKQDIFFMRLALAEARKGLGRTSPNPCVGAVIVKGGEIVGRGYHEKAGTPHAEIHALRMAGEKADGATLYVTLEPCCHSGKTPPCTHAVVAGGIKRVVVGMLDPNPLVNGGGITYLLEKGIQVISSVLAEECRNINRPFIKYITSGRPLVVLKAGVSLDGRLNYSSGKSGWITGPQALEEAHRLRNTYDSLMVGGRTVAIDNPSLTTRLEDGKGRDPVRIILDSHLGISSSARVLNLDSPAPTWIFCRHAADPDRLQRVEEKGGEVFTVATDSEGNLDLLQILDILGKKKVTSVLVEGGGTLHASFLKRQLADQVSLFYAPLFAGSNGVSLTSGLNIGDQGGAIRLANVHYTRVGDDIMVQGALLYPTGS